MRAVVVRAAAARASTAARCATIWAGPPIRNTRRGRRSAGKPGHGVLPRRATSAAQRKIEMACLGRSCSAIGRCTGCARDALALAGAVADASGAAHRRRLGVFPPFTALARGGAAQLAGTGVVVGGQDCHAEPKGAFTGSIARRDAEGCGRHGGHRRPFRAPPRLGRDRRPDQGQGRPPALAAGLLVVLCIGETEAERAAGADGGGARPPADRQLAGEAVAADRLVVAYEPVWAIGTGRTATLADIAESHAAIGRRLAALAPRGRGDRDPLRRLGQGRQCRARSWRSPGVAGVLVGGASLDAGRLLVHLSGGRRALDAASASLSSASSSSLRSCPLRS